jgi:helix-turn-helix protein
MRGAYTNATVTRREEYSRIRGRRTRLFPGSGVGGTGDFTHFFKIVAASVKELMNMAGMNVELLKLGFRVRASRKMLGLNQKDFSKDCGLDRSYFGGVERGERNLTFSSLCQICTGLNCDIAALTKGIPHLTNTPK